MNRGLVAAVVGVGVAVALGLVYYFDRKEESVEATVAPAVSAPAESASNGTATNEPAPAAEATSESAPLETAAGETAAGETAAGETAAGETSAGDTMQAASPESNADDSSAVASELQSAALPAATASGDAAASAVLPPSFDVVRVEQSGEGVIAGRAPAGCLVIVYDGTVEIGRVRADAAGNWVLILTSALAPGTHELRVVARLDSGEELRAEQAAIIALQGPDSLQAIKDAAEHGLASAVEEMKGPPPASATAASLSAETADSPRLAAADTESTGRASDAPDPMADPLAEPLVVLVPDGGDGASQVLQGGPDVQGEGIADKDLVLNSIDYDEDGKALVAGRGAPGSKVVVYLDNQPLAAAQVDGEGNWPAVLDKPIEPGLHSLRVDQVDDSGKVVARVETPFSRADLGANEIAEGSVIVQPGNSLWRIARRVYGEGIRYSVLYQSNSNQIVDPDLIYPGQIFTVPKLQ